MNQYGMNAGEWADFERLVIRPLKDSGFKVWIFGSRARGSNVKFSDVDVLVQPETAASALYGKTTLNDIREKAEESRFPYRLDIVLVSDLAESYRDGVLNERVEL